MKLKQVLLIVTISAGSAIASVWGYNKFAQKQATFVQSVNGVPANYAGFFDGKNASGPADFTKAANAAVQAVVHIKTKIPAKKVSNNLPRQNRGFFDDWFDDMFGGPSIIPEQRASGSGVIISEDGYIVTNNHVISDEGGNAATEITVTLHNSTKPYKARVIGKDPNYDLAVLKIDGKGLPFMLYGNSDDIQLGQWVLAVGYPLSLETTVTAGIISAKGRSIGINSRQGQAPVESFIQTDAAVNSGNSGGALVNTDGQLIGINSAILAPSGTYAGYSFAIPVTLVKKVVSDLIQYGNVQRGYLGVRYNELTEDEQKDVGYGVRVNAVAPDGPAKIAGLQRDDIITKINGNVVTSGLEMSSMLANYKPGDKVQVTYKRKGIDNTATVTLKKDPGSYASVDTEIVGTQLGADLETLDSKKADEYGIDGGVVVKSIRKGGKLSTTRMENGFIITSVSGYTVKSVEELGRLLSNARGTVKIEGMYPGSDMYTYPLNMKD